MGNVMKRPHILALFFLLTNSSFALTYVYELWTNLMGYCYGVDENLATVYLTVATVTYITSLLSMPVLIKSTDKKFLLSVALIIAVLSTQVLFIIIFFFNLLINYFSLCLLQHGSGFLEKKESW